MLYSTLHTVHSLIGFNRLKFSVPTLCTEMCVFSFLPASHNSVQLLIALCQRSISSSLLACVTIIVTDCLIEWKNFRLLENHMFYLFGHRAMAWSSPYHIVGPFFRCRFLQFAKFLVLRICCHLERQTEQSGRRLLFLHEITPDE